jgi:hypothetical protein
MHGNSASILTPGILDDAIAKELLKEGKVIN